MDAPKWPIKWLERLLLPELLEHLEGDLNELFQERLVSSGPAKARRLFYWDCLQLLRPALSQSFVPRSNFSIMFLNHFKVGYRNLLKYKAYTALNLLGLSLGITAAITLYRVVAFDSSYDKFHTNVANIYRLAENSPEFGIYHQTRTPASAHIKAVLPEVKLATRFFRPHNKWFSTGEKRLNKSVTYVDPDFAGMFSFKVLEGDLEKTLTTKNHIAISRDVARAFFGYEKAVGQTLHPGEDESPYIVGAVLENAPFNSTLEFETIMSWDHIPDWLRRAGNWHNTFMTCYIQLESGRSITEIAPKLDQIAEENFLPQGDDARFHPIALSSLYDEIAGNQNTRILLLIIALITLVIAFVNFLNLSTAQALHRIREVGIRKVMGSSRSDLILQFIMEAILLCLLAVSIAFLLSVALTGFVNDFFELHLPTDLSLILRLIFILLGMAFGLGAVTGCYPAMYLANRKMMAALKGDSKKGSGKTLIQQILIVFQYVTSVALIAGTVIIWKQIGFMKEQNLKVQTDQVVVIDIDYSAFMDSERAKTAVRTFRKNLNDQSFISAAAFASNAPGNYAMNYNNFRDVAANLEVHLRQTNFGANVIPTLNIELLHGRNFSQALATDSLAVIINEAAFKAFGWTDLENKKLRQSGDPQAYNVVGVVANYHYRALMEDVEPMIHWYLGKEGLSNRLIVRYAEGRSEQTIEYLKKTWSETGSFEPLNYYFLDSRYAELYRGQEKIGMVTTSFTVVAIILASLGLFALASFMIRQKRKEIGIRKVMGATVKQITLTLSKNFFLLVILAILIGIPLVWFVSNQFLENFSYRVVPGIAVYAIAALGAISMAALSVSIRAYLAATDNPALSLRDE